MIFVITGWGEAAEAEYLLLVSQGHWAALPTEQNLISFKDRMSFINQTKKTHFVLKDRTKQTTTLPDL